MADMTDDEIIERAEEFITKAIAYWTPHHDRFKRIKRFVRVHGETGQWDDNEWADRQSQNPPRLTLTENLLGPFCNQVSNDLKKSRFGAKVKPKDSGTDIRLAKVRQGVHRGVQQNGGFEQALSRAIEDLVDGGLGAWRFVTRYADPLAFNKEIKYLESDPTRLFHGDGTNIESDFSDVRDSIYFQSYNPEAFESEFGMDPDTFLGGGDCSPVWGTKDEGPRVSEYFFKQEIPDTLVKASEDPNLESLLKMANLRPGRSYYLSEFKQKLKEVTETLGTKAEDYIAVDDSGDRITRDTHRCQIWWAKLAHKKVLKKEKWPGYFIPNFLATGRKVSIDGEMKYYGLAEPAIHVQKAHNYSFSALVERAGLAPRSQISMPVEGMDPKYQRIYDNINTYNGILPYKSVDDRGNAIAPPQREAPIQTDPAFATLRQMTLQGIKDTLGMWETSLGAQSNEKSGVAINARERQADTGNYDWGANLALTAEHCFRTTDEVLNKVIDLPTQIRIVGEDDKDDVIWAASLEENDPNPNQYFDLNRGKFDVYCEMSPSADTKREEQSKGMEMLFTGNPTLSAGLAPEYIAVQDWENADKMAEIAKKLRAAQFPNVKFDEAEGQQTQQMQQQLQQANQQAQQMQQQLQAMQQQLQQAQQAMQQVQQLQMENQSMKADKSLDAQRLEIEKFKADTDRMKAEADIRIKHGHMLLASDDQEHDQTIENAKAIHDAQVRQHAAELSAAKHQHLSNIDLEKMRQAQEQMSLANQVSAQVESEPAQLGDSSAPDVKR